MPLIETKGAASAQGFGLTLQQAAANYIEDVFSTWLYTGTGANQTITNGIDLAGKGGLVWFKDRNVAASHRLFDTARGTGKTISSNLTSAQATDNTMLTAFNAAGFSLGTDSSGGVNENGNSYVSWTFRKQPKFFDVVTWTGNGTGSRAISHSLASTPGCIILKRTDAADDWYVVHRSASNFGNYAVLNTTAAFTTSINSGISSVGSTSFTVSSYYNGSGATWVAYVFAHDAGGFGLTGTDNVISCGEFTTNGSGAATVSLGYEPQWIMIKGKDNTAGWSMWDTMRGLPVGGADAYLFANSSAAEATFNNVDINATGFNAVGWGSSSTYIYIAIRRGPMKTPTSGTSVYTGITRTGTGATANITGTGFPPDSVIVKQRGPSGNSTVWNDKLRGPNRELYSNNTDAEFAGSDGFNSFNQNGFSLGANTANMNDSGATYVNWAFRRAPGFFDVVCFTSTGSSTQAINHNLGVTPELIIEKVRNNTSDWAVQQIPANKYGSLNSTSAMSSWSSTGISAPTATVFSPAGFPAGRTEVAYLFASCPGVSKVGSYTGDGTVDRVIDCGFTSGARFIMLKKTSTTSGWYVYDTARGISSSGEASLLLNSTAAESGVADVIDPASVGFSVGTSSSDFFNESGVSYIFLAIA